MKIVPLKGRAHSLGLSFTYTAERVAFCRLLKEQYGWQDFGYTESDGEKLWVFSKPEILRAIKERFPDVEIDPNVMALLGEYGQFLLTEAERGHANEILKIAEDSDIKVPGLKGELYSYQRVGVEFLVRNNGNAILADQMGTGKTVQTLSYILATKQERSLIVCPGSVKYSWEGEVAKWTKLKSVVIDSKTDLSKIPPEVDIWIINYDILIKHLPQLLKTRFTYMAGDEAHYLKNPKAKRTKAFMSIARTVPGVTLLSGTPMLSRPVELFPLLHIIDPTTWNNWFAFTQKYCAGHRGRWGYDATGASNIPELKDRIARYFLRRIKGDVLKELPPKIFIPTPVEMDAAHTKQYAAAEKDLRTFLKQFRGKTDPEVKKSMQAEKLTKINLLREISSTGKIPAAEEIIQSILDNGEKVIVFSSFMHPLTVLHDKYRTESVMITGQTPMEERGEAVKAFQNDPDIKIFFGGIKSAGVGITLTEANNVVFLDYPWNPADLVQAQDRAHRPGQTSDSVNIYQLYTPGTIDAFMRSTLQEKQKLFEQLIEKGTPVDKDKVASVLDDAFSWVEADGS